MCVLVLVCMCDYVVPECMHVCAWLSMHACAWACTETYNPGEGRSFNHRRLQSTAGKASGHLRLIRDTNQQYHPRSASVLLRGHLGILKEEPIKDLLMRNSNTSYYILEQCEEPGSTCVIHSIIYAHSRVWRPRLRGQQVGWDLNPLVPLVTHKRGLTPCCMCALSFKEHLSCPALPRPLDTELTQPTVGTDPRPFSPSRGCDKGLGVQRVEAQGPHPLGL